MAIVKKTKRSEKRDAKKDERAKLKLVGKGTETESPTAEAQAARTLDKKFTEAIDAHYEKLEDLRQAKQTYDELVADLKEEEQHATGKLPELKNATKAVKDLVKATEKLVDEEAAAVAEVEKSQKEFREKNSGLLGGSAGRMVKRPKKASKRAAKGKRRK